MAEPNAASGRSPSFRAAVAFWAVLLGGYSLVLANVYGWREWNIRFDSLSQINSAFTYLTFFVNVFLIYSILKRDDRILRGVLLPAIASYIMCTVLSLCTILYLIPNGYSEVAVWEMPHFLSFTYHLYLMFRLRAELQDDQQTEQQTQPPVAGWLKNNMALQLPPPSAQENDRSKAQEEGISIISPAVLTLSSCTPLGTAHQQPPPPYSDPPAAVHQSPPPPYSSPISSSVRLSPPPPYSGPPSSSEA